MRIWRSLLTLVIIWVIAAGAFVVVQRFRSTPEKFINYVAEHPLRGLGPAEREAIILEAARLLNGLNTKQRREVKKSGALRTLFTELTKDERRERVDEALAKVGMTPRAKHYPAQLSGGQQQRVAVARALGGRPSILLADEPTGNLDSKNGEAVMTLLRELHAEGATICLVTHDDRFARDAQKTIRLFDGQVVTEEVAAASRT